MKHIGAWLLCLLVVSLSASAKISNYHKPSAKQRPISLADRLTQSLIRVSTPRIELTKRLNKAAFPKDDKKASEHWTTHYGTPVYGELGHDIEKTTSLTSPYMGYATLECHVPYTIIWETDPNDSFPPPNPRSGTLDVGTKLTYAYQDGKWVFKSQEDLHPDDTPTL